MGSTKRAGRKEEQGVLEQVLLCSEIAGKRTVNYPKSHSGHYKSICRYDTLRTIASAA